MNTAVAAQPPVAAWRSVRPSLAASLVALFCAWLACLTAAEVCHAASPRANLIAIVTDDQGRWAVGAYGNYEIRTPNLDRLAHEGARLTNAFALTPVCSPSRATYMTGLYPTQVGITDYLMAEEEAAGQGIKAPTWPHVLAAAGYRTALIGKWHLGSLPQFHPTRHGFNHFMGFLGGGNTPMNPRLEVEGREQPLDGPLPDLLVDEAIRFLRANRDQPFALCLHFREPHRPYGPVPAVDSDPYRDLDPTVPQTPGADVESLKRETRDYYASIGAVDRNVGRLLAALDELSLTGKTIVSFTSDHGYNLGRHGIDTKGNGQWIAGGVRGPKRPNMWDTSIRVPFLIRWPGVISPGTVIDETFTTLDMYRTVMGALEVPLTEDCQAQGIDFSVRLRGGKIEEPEAIYGQYDLHNQGLAYMRMIRTPKYKYVQHFKANGLDELYDLEQDPDESRNLAGRREELSGVLSELSKRLHAWQASIGDPLAPRE